MINYLVGKSNGKKISFLFFFSQKCTLKGKKYILTRIKRPINKVVWTINTNERVNNITKIVKQQKKHYILYK